MLLDAGASLTATDGVGYTPLMHAGKFGHVEIIRLLVKRVTGDALNAQDNWGDTPLIHTVENNKVDAVRALLDANESARGLARCDVNFINKKKSQTALDRCHQNHTEMRALLISYNGKTLAELNVTF